MTALPSPPAPPPMRVVAGPLLRLRLWWLKTWCAAVSDGTWPEPAPGREFGVRIEGLCARCFLTCHDLYGGMCPECIRKKAGDGFISADEFRRRDAAMMPGASVRLRGRVSRSSNLKRGRTSIVITFGIDEPRARELLTPDTLVELEVRRP